MYCSTIGVVYLLIKPSFSTTTTITTTITTTTFAQLGVTSDLELRQLDFLFSVVLSVQLYCSCTIGALTLFTSYSVLKR